MRYQWMWIGLVLLAGCIAKKEVRTAREATIAEQWDQAYEMWSVIFEADHENTRAELEKERARHKATLMHLQKANYYLSRNQLDEAEFELNLTLTYDAHNQEAQRLRQVITERREAEASERAASRANNLPDRSNLPILSPKSLGPLNLYFPKPTSVRDIYISLGRTYEINIVVDSKIRSNEKISLDLRNLNFFKALETLMVLNRHFFKVIDNNTIVILEDNKNNRDRYDNQIIQTFYLSNITPGDLKTHLRNLGGIKEFAENEKLNAITIKGTPEQVALAEKIIRDNDKPQPEVVIEIEVLEVNKNNLRRIGIQPVGLDGSPLYRAGLLASPRDRSDDDADLNGLRGIFPSLGSEDFLTLVPAIAIDFLKEKGDSKQVANPHLRVTSGEAGVIRIGQRIPIAQTSFTNAQLSGSSSGLNNFGDQALTTFNYDDIGIRIEVTPRVHYNNEISLMLELEISSVISGGFQPILGTRNVTTSLRLKNGETNVLAGLLTNEERNSLTGIPGLSDIPFLGKLFTNDEKIASQTDIIMTIRPVIIRGPNITSQDRAPYELSTLRLSNLAARARVPEKQDWDWDSGQDGPGNQDPDASFQPLAPEEDEAPVETTGGDAELPTEIAAPETMPAMLAFTPNIVEVRQDDLLEFQLFITNVEEMKRGEIALEFDPEVLQAETVEIGDFFNAQGSRPLLTPAWNNLNGRVSLVITQRSDANPFSGSGIMASVMFRAKAPGSGMLRFVHIELKTPDQEIIEAEGLSATYEVLP